MTPLDSWLLERWWAGAALTAVVVASDYGLTHWGARLYRTNSRVAVEGSYETSQTFQSDIDEARTLGIRSLAVLAAYVAVVAIAGGLRSQLGISGELYLFLVGFFVLQEVPVHLRHLSNIVSFRLLRNPAAAEGSIRYSRRYVLQTTGAYFLGFCGAFTILYATAPHPLTAGGMARCAAIGVGYLLSSVRAGCRSTPGVA